MARGIARFFTTALTVETYTGTDPATGRDLFAAPVVVTGFLQEQRQLVRASDGEQVQASTTVFAPVSAAGVLLPNSRVTPPSGNVSRLITATTNSIGSPADHVVATLT